MTVKQVIVVRKDLKMRRGKEIAQGSHASNAFLIQTIKALINGFNINGCITTEEIDWMDSGMTKITLQVNSEEELLDIYKKAEEAELEVHIITDSGKTEFDGKPTKTALAIGPDQEEYIDPITGHLKLY